jgi:hypothetical protein
MITQSANSECVRSGALETVGIFHLRQLSAVELKINRISGSGRHVCAQLPGLKNWRFLAKSCRLCLFLKVDRFFANIVQ